MLFRSFSVAFANARDLAGNIVQGTAVVGSNDSETTIPSVHTIYRSTTSNDLLIVRFTEPCGQLDDLYDVSTNQIGQPLSANCWRMGSTRVKARRGAKSEG